LSSIVYDFKEKMRELGMVRHTCNPSILESEVGGL
jgi:hypothetical protein